MVITLPLTACAVQVLGSSKALHCAFSTTRGDTAASSKTLHCVQRNTSLFHHAVIPVLPLSLTACDVQMLGSKRDHSLLRRMLAEWIQTSRDATAGRRRLNCAVVRMARLATRLAWDHWKVRA